mgnify:CR=1 FL=1
MSTCDLPLGKPSLLKPDHKKCPSTEDIENEQESWWERLANEEVAKRER